MRSTGRLGSAYMVVVPQKSVSIALLGLAAAFAIDPGFAEALVLRASRKVVARRYEEAIDDVRKAQQLEAGIPWATIVHAEACNGLRRFDEAFMLLDSLKSTELGTWQAKYEMTRAVVGRREALAAMQWSKLALDAVPDSALPNALLLRADAFLLARRWPEAVEQFNRYLALDEPLLLRTQVLAVRERIERLVAEPRNSTIAAQ